MATHDNLKNFKNFHILVSLKLNYDLGIEECAKECYKWNLICFIIYLVSVTYEYSFYFEKMVVCKN